MNEKPLEVGEIGALQNIVGRWSYLNGMIAEIEKPLGYYRTLCLDTGKKYHHDFGYRIKVAIDREVGFVIPKQIRKLTDPDVEQKTEKEVRVQS